VQAAVRPVLIVMGLVIAQDPPQMGLVPHEGAVQELASASPDPAFGYRVHAGVPTLHSTVRMPASARAASNAAVKSAPRSRIMNLTRCVLLAEVHEQVAGLLGCPFPGWMHSDAEDADAPGGVLGHGQNVAGCRRAGRP